MKAFDWFHGNSGSRTGDGFSGWPDGDGGGSSGSGRGPSLPSVIEGFGGALANGDGRGGAEEQAEGDGP
jgi:hypothetical protein